MRLLVLSYLKAVPGFPVFASIGGICAVAGWVEREPATALAWMGAALCFVVAGPALFAGSHFRHLASRGSHALLPGFTQAMLGAALLLMLLLAAISGGFTASMLGIPWLAGTLIAFIAWSGIFWFGFLPTPLRMLLGFALIAGFLFDPEWLRSWSASSSYPRAAALGSAVLLGAAGWSVFCVWFAAFMRRRSPFQRSDRASWNLPLALESRALEQVGTAAGSLLLGQGDGLRIRSFRATLGVLGIPLLMYTMLWLGAGLELLDLAANAVLAFLALTYALGLFTHLCLKAARRRPLLWLRGDWDMVGLSRLAERVLWKEWQALAVAWVLLLLIVGLFSGSFPSRLFHLGVAWLAGLLLHLYIALWPRASDRWQKLAFFVHLLALVGALAAERIGIDTNALFKLASLQIIAVVVIRQIGLRRSARGLSLG